MKKMICGIVAAISLIGSGVFYPDTMKITEIDREHDLVICETATGFEYAFYGAEDYQPGWLVSVIMFNSLTDTVLDDEIVAARYAGDFEED